MQTPKVKKVRKQMRQRVRIGRPFSDSQMQLVIFLRFGSLDTDKRHWHTAREVFDRTGIKHGAQFNIIQRWIERGYKIVSYIRKRG